MSDLHGRRGNERDQRAGASRVFYISSQRNKRLCVLTQLQKVGLPLVASDIE